ncbi:MAG: hypothetical protein DMF87_23875 [Acidobacteria bacterium]|nr:MAG: hypothetical protein DMF87_23875 [Acidobacteriota bacterium]
MSRTNRGSCSWGSGRPSSREGDEDGVNHEGREEHEVKKFVFFAAFVAFVVSWFSWSWLVAAQTEGRINIPYSDAKPILDALRPELIPDALRSLTPMQREASWPAWVSTRDTEIRERLAAGDEDSVITFLLFGVTFTSQPRYSFATAVATREPDAVVADPVVQARIKDLVAAVASPGANERLQFARRVIERHGIDFTTDMGRQGAREVLRAALTRMLADYDAYFRDSAPGATLFRNRGLSSDTSIYAAFAIDAALKDAAAMGVLKQGSVRRVAVIGPGLDFTDKQEGYDFYPVQTIQPFAVTDSLRARNLAAPRDFQLMTYDLNPRVNDHIAAARQRAARGAGYTIQLPRDPAQQWERDLLGYWTRVGGKIGATVPPVAPPPAAGRVDVRAVRIRPDVVQMITPRDLDIILQRPEPLPDSDRFDLVIATNILIYYDVFEQSLALANIARMLHSEGVLLTNNPLFELPAIPVHQIGETKAIYTDGGSDWIAWYQRE